jgi:hypothetical protein
MMSQTLKTRIYEFVYHRQTVSFQELIESFMSEVKGRHLIGIEGNPEIIIWLKLNLRTIRAVVKLSERKAIVLARYSDSRLNYYLYRYGLRPSVPMCDEIKHYKSPRWLPCFLTTPSNLHNSTDIEAIGADICEIRVDRRSGNDR